MRTPDGPFTIVAYSQGRDLQKKALAANLGSGLELWAAPASTRLSPCKKMGIVPFTTRDAMTGECCLLAGCGLCLRIAQAELDSSGSLLQESAIVPKAIYVKIDENGSMVYESMVYEPLTDKIRY